MNDKSALLNQLRIDRSSDPTPSRRGRPWLIAAILLALAAAAGAWFVLRPTATAVRVAVAVTASTERGERNSTARPTAL